jgi:hypothetical protein
MEIARPFLLGKIKETWLNPLPKDVASPYLVGEVLDKIAQGLHPLIHLHVEENEKLKK